MKLKRVILASLTSYSYVLKLILNDLLSEGKKAEISQDHKCVNEYDNDGFIIGQHYPRETEPTKSTRGRFVKVPEGKGNYIMVTSEYKKRNFTNDDHLIKHVDKTNKDSRWNKK